MSAKTSRIGREQSASTILLREDRWNRFLPEIMNAPAADWLTAAAPAKTLNIKEYLGCAICLGTLSRAVELACGHKFCWVCLANAPRAHTCPLCRKVHILDPGMLRERRDAFRQGYRSWRMGRAHGARGEVTNIPKATHSATRNMAPALHDERLGKHDLAGVGVGEERPGSPTLIPDSRSVFRSSFRHDAFRASSFFSSLAPFSRAFAPFFANFLAPFSAPRSAGWARR